MYKQQFCESCNQKYRCQEAYQQLGKAKAPLTVPKVVVAFLLPIVVFIVSLATFERVLAKAVNAKQLQTVLGFLLALLVTSASVLIMKALDRQFSKNK